MSWASKSHRGKPSFYKQSKKVFEKPADPWLYMGNGEFIKYSEFINRRNNASKV